MISIWITAGVLALAVVVLVLLAQAFDRQAEADRLAQEAARRELRRQAALEAWNRWCARHPFVGAGPQ